MEEKVPVQNASFRFAERKRWEKQVGIHFVDNLLPFPETIDTDKDMLDSWLRTMQIRPDPRPGKCGFWYSPRSFRLLRTLTSDNRMIYLHRGSGNVRIGKNGKPQRIRAGDALLIPPSLDHDFVADKNTAVFFFAIHFDIHLLGGVNPLELIGFPRLIPGSPQAPFTTASMRMAREFSARAPGWELAIASELQLVLLYLLRFQGSGFQPFHKRSRGRQFIRLLPALELIDRRLNDPTLRVGELAESVSVSEIYLRRLFREVMDISPGIFLQRRRIEHASILLRDSRHSLKSVASQSGFVHMSHFFRTFRRWTQMTPSQFRVAEIGI
jgi:AraC-like DNA-binding protein